MARPAAHTRIGTKAAVLSVLGLTLFGAFLRIVSITSRSFWLDEATAVRQASRPIKLMLELMSFNVHPPLFHALLHYWIQVFGRSEVAVRAFPTMFGIAAVPLAYWVGATIYDRRVGLISCGIMAISPFYIWYSQEARMYAMLLVFALVSIGAIWKAIDTGHFGWWALYSLATALGLMTQYFFIFLVVGQSLYFLLFVIVKEEQAADAEGTKRLSWKRPWAVVQDVPESVGWLASLLFAAVPLAWWLPNVLIHKALLGKVSEPLNYGWEAPRVGINFNELMLVPVEMVTGFHSQIATRDLVAMWPLLISFALLFVGWAHRVSSRTWFLILSGVTGATIMAALGQWQPILDARYFIAATAPLVFLLARFLTEFKPPVFNLLLVVLVVGSLFGWADQSYNPSSIVKWQNREAMNVVAEGYRPGDVILLSPHFTSSIAEYYLPPDAYSTIIRVPGFDAEGRLRNLPSQLAEDLDRKVGPARRVWLISTWEDTPRIALDRRNTARWLTGAGYVLKKEWRFFRIRVALYEGTPKRKFFIQPEVR
ncbi:MAG: glycosyltransferase family 39 protein [Coriobacteriales bacterium]|nr:glycosyltransferase family 39 protein [Coriobacteriales bacterium]